MKLAAYLKSQDISAEEFAQILKVSRSAVHRWAKGERKPVKHMPQIVKATGGKVQPNDFYEAA